MESIRGVLRRTSLAFVRHGNTHSAKECGGRDFDRILSPLGLAQCAAARRTWLPVLRQAAGELSRYAVASSATRCCQTLGEILGEGTPVLRDPVLYDDILQPEAEGLWAACGYAPIADYFQQPGGEAFLRAYAERVVERLAQVVAENEDDTREVLVVCGHSMYANAVVYFSALELGMDPSVPLHNKLAETDGFLLLQLPEEGESPRPSGAGQNASSSSLFPPRGTGPVLLSTLPDMLSPISAADTGGTQGGIDGGKGG